MQTTPSPKQTSEHVAGPGKGWVALTAVLALTALTWFGLWSLHQRWYADPLNPVAPAQSAASPN